MNIKPFENNGGYNIHQPLSKTDVFEDKKKRIVFFGSDQNFVKSLNKEQREFIFESLKFIEEKNVNLLNLQLIQPRYQELNNKYNNFKPSSHKNSTIAEKVGKFFKNLFGLRISSNEIVNMAQQERQNCKHSNNRSEM